MLKKKTTPERSTAAAFPRYLTGEVVADSVALQWPGLYARRFRLPGVVDRFLVPATPEPHIACNLRGMAEFRERDIGGAWITRKIGAGDLFVTRSRTPYEVVFRSPPGQELDTLAIHIAVEPFLAALEVRYPGKADRVEVVDFFGRDEILWSICLTCAELLAARVPGKSPRISSRNTRVRRGRRRSIAAVCPSGSYARLRITSRRISKRKSQSNSLPAWWN